MMEDGGPIGRPLNELLQINKVAYSLYFNPSRYDVRVLAEVSSMLKVIWDEPVFDMFECIIRTTLCFFGYARQFSVAPVVVVRNHTTLDGRRSLYSNVIPDNWRDALKTGPGFRSARYTVDWRTHTLVLKFHHPAVPPNNNDYVKIGLWVRGSPDGCWGYAGILTAFVESYIQTKQWERTVLYIKAILHSAFSYRLIDLGLLNPFFLLEETRMHLLPLDEEPNPEVIEALAVRNGVIPLPKQ